MRDDLENPITRAIANALFEQAMAAGDKTCMIEGTHAELRGRFDLEGVARAVSAALSGDPQ